MSCSNSLKNFDFSFLEGKWYVAHSTLKLWKTGGRVNPSITYSELKTQPDGTALWRDEVNFQQPGTFSSALKAKSIVGYDRQKAKGSPEFMWRGKGLLAIVTCPCEVLYLDQDAGWLLMFFEKTAFTEAGLDVLSRKPEDLSEETLAAIEERLKTEFPQFHRPVLSCGLAPTKKAR